VPLGPGGCPGGQLAGVPGWPRPVLSAAAPAMVDWATVAWATGRLTDAGPDAQPDIATVAANAAVAIHRPIVRRDPPMRR
jgi:hypothetical protein